MLRAFWLRGRGGGGTNAAGVLYFLAGAQAWHAEAEACAGQMSAVCTALQMDTVARDMARASAARGHMCRMYQPQRLTSAAMDPSFA